MSLLTSSLIKISNPFLGFFLARNFAKKVWFVIVFSPNYYWTYFIVTACL